MAELNIRGMRFYGYHGVYEQEREEGGWFEVDACIHWQPDTMALLEDDLSATINYEFIFTATQAVMQAPVQLIENLTIRIYQDILLNLPPDSRLQVRVRKLLPPVGGEVEYAEFVWGDV